MGRHPIVQQENFPCLFRVSSFVRLEKIRAAEIDEEHRKTNETHKPGKVAWWEIDRGNV
jgi:hypothetical protein